MSPLQRRGQRILIIGLILWGLPSVRAYFALKRGTASIYEL